MSSPTQVAPGAQQQPDIKIADVRATVVGAPWRELLFVELVTDVGLTGVGEVRVLNKTETLTACVRELADRYVIGTDPFSTENLARNVQRADYGRPGEVIQSALAAFDTACWDIKGKALGVPVWKLLGGACRQRIPAYANGWYTTGHEVDQIAAAAQTVIDRGYQAIKLDPFGAASAELTAAQRRHAIDIVASVRDAVGPDVGLMIEMHGRFTAATAVQIARALEAYEPEWFEEPVPPENAAACVDVRRKLHTPIATGERIHHLPEFREHFESASLDIVQADLTHFGGFLEMKRLAGWADSYYTLMAPHNVCGPVGTAANVHFAAATPNYKVLEHFNDFADNWVLGLVDQAPTVDPQDGCFALPQSPGLGVHLDHEACAAHPPSGAHFQLFSPGWEARGQS
jgi:galactonate dehydratase